MTGWKDKSKIMQRYDLTSEMYDERYSEEQKAKYDAALVKVNVTGSRVLDVGCGSGLFFKEIASLADMVVGVDISRKLLFKSQNHVKVFRNVFVVQADADHLPLVKGFFDAVFAFTVLQNMPKPSETLNELKIVVKPEGKVIVTALKKAFALPTFMDLLEAAGFKVVGFVDDEALKCYVSELEINMFASET